MSRPTQTKPKKQEKKRAWIDGSRSLLFSPNTVVPLEEERAPAALEFAVRHDGLRTTTFEWIGLAATLECTHVESDTTHSSCHRDK